MKSKISCLWLFPIIILSILIGYLSTQYKYFEFEYKISLLDFISLLSTIYIGIYIAKQIHNSLESSRVEKDLIIDIIKSCIQKAKEIQQLVDSNNIDFTIIMKATKEFSIQLHELEEYQNVFNNSNSSIVLKPTYLNIKRLLTRNSPVNNTIILNRFDQSSAKSEIKTLTLNLLKILVETNRK